MRMRYCDAPAPANGGRPCAGDGSQVGTCRQIPCKGKVEGEGAKEEAEKAEEIEEVEEAEEEEAEEEGEVEESRRGGKIAARSTG